MSQVVEQIQLLEFSIYNSQFSNKSQILNHKHENLEQEKLADEILEFNQPAANVFPDLAQRDGVSREIPQQRDIRVWENVLPLDKCGFSYRHSIFKKHPEWIILGATLNLKRGDQAESRKKIIEYTKKRAQTQDIGEKCAGCIFKNPKPDLAAAYLIDKAGLKGKVVGNAMVSQKHANYIVNTGGATSADVKNLIEIIKSEVQKVHGVALEEEIRFID